jgi:hypothetical protein
MLHLFFAEIGLCYTVTPASGGRRKMYEGRGVSYFSRKAKRTWRGAEWIIGMGRMPASPGAGGVTVMLCGSREVAEARKAEIDASGSVEAASATTRLFSRTQRRMTLAFLGGEKRGEEN